MSIEIALHLTGTDGNTKQRRVPISKTELDLYNGQLVAVSGNIAQLTRLTVLRLYFNAFAEIPSGVLKMTQLTWLNVSNNRLATIPREIGCLRALTELHLYNNTLASLPREIGHVHALKLLHLDNNGLTSLPSELGQLRSLRQLYLRWNGLVWLPSALRRLPAMMLIYLSGNPLPIVVGGPGDDSRSLLPEIFAATTALAMIREEATMVAIGLQDLELPALVTLEIVDAAFPNSIPMYKKWDLVVAVKHFHQRRAQ